MNTNKQGMALLLAAILAGSAQAAFITVNTLDNESNSDGDCSLREAILSANQNTSFDGCNAGSSIGTDSIFVAVSGTINVASSIGITESLDLFGPGRDALTISANNSSGIFVVNMPDDTHDFDLSLMTIADASESVSGAALWIQRAGTVIVELMRFSNNHVTSSNQSGGAIAVQLPSGVNMPRLEIIRSLFEGNTAGRNGGALDIDGELSTLVIEESEFIGNVAGSNGGAIYTRDVGTMRVDRSRFHDNQCLFSGGAIRRGNADSDTSEFFHITNTTFTANRTTAINGGQGGALSIDASTSLLENNTFYGNREENGSGHAITASGDSAVALFFNTIVENRRPTGSPGIALRSLEQSEIKIGHTIVWSNMPASSSFNECLGQIISLGFNIDGGGSCTGHATDLPMTDPRLSPVGNFGDDTSWVELQTGHPLVTSPAIDGGSSGPCTGGFGATIAVDQRGESRPVDGDGSGGTKCDIGAVEVQPGSEPDSYVLTALVVGEGTIISDPRGIECLLDCEQPYLAGTSVSLSVVPQPGSQFDGWSGDCSGIGGCTVTMNGDRSVGATFILADVELSVSVDGAGSGTVKSTPSGIDCPGSCTAAFAQATSVALTPTPDAGSMFAGWSGACTGTASCSVNMDQDRSVTATFEPMVITHPVDVELDGNGVGMVTSVPAGIDCPGDCSETFEDGTSITLSAIAGASSEFLGWSADCSFAGSGACQLTVEQAYRAIAIFGDGDLLFLDGFE